MLLNVKKFVCNVEDGIRLRNLKYRKPCVQKPLDKLYNIVKLIICMFFCL